MKKWLIVLCCVAVTYAARVPPLAAIERVQDLEDVLLLNDDYQKAASVSTEATSTETQSSTSEAGRSSSDGSTDGSSSVGSTDGLSSDGSTDGLSSDGSTDGSIVSGSTDSVSSSTSDPNGGGDPNGDLSPGAIAGIVIGSVAGAAIIAGGIVFYMKKKTLGCFKK